MVVDSLALPTPTRDPQPRPHRPSHQQPACRGRPPSVCEKDGHPERAEGDSSKFEWSSSQTVQVQLRFP